jgi:hypothetical protein
MARWSTFDEMQENDESSPACLTQDADALIAQEMAGLSVEEREKSLYDIHGVSDVIEETPNFVREKLAQLNEELAQIAEKAAYFQAEVQSRGYVSCSKFRLRFLRAECFDPKLAAERLVRFFQEKLGLFGFEKLTKDIHLSDLDKNDLRCLHAGIGQILPLRDRAGRCVIAWIPPVLGTDETSREATPLINRVCTTLLSRWIVAFILSDLFFFLLLLFASYGSRTT